MAETLIRDSDKKPDTAETVADVFISYSSKSWDVAKAITNALKEAGISYWIDQRNIEASQDFSKEIPKAIQNCKVFLLILDKHSNQSKHVKNEVAIAFNTGKTILPFKTDKCEISTEISYFLPRVQFMPGNPPDAQHISALIRRIAKILGVEAPPEKPTRGAKLLKEWKLPVLFAIIALLFMAVVRVTALRPEHIKWTLENGVLTISGEGPMENYQLDNTPWWEQRRDITKVEVKGGVTSIGDWAFYDCRNLTVAIIHDGVTSIGKHAFYDCSSLTKVTIHDGNLTAIGYEAFMDCNNLTVINIPNGVTTIAEEAFYSCNSLMAVDIPDSVVEIGDFAFAYCTKLSRASVPKQAKIGSGAFSVTRVQNIELRES